MLKDKSVQISQHGRCRVICLMVSQAGRWELLHVGKSVKGLTCSCGAKEAFMSLLQHRQATQIHPGLPMSWPVTV